MTAAPPLDWIKQIDASLAALDEKPQFGQSPSFDWEALQQGVQNLLSRSDLKLSHTVQGWMAPNQLFAGLGASTLPLSIMWSPLQKQCFFVTDKLNLKHLMASLMESEEAAQFFYDSAYVEGFYTYFATEILYLFEKQGFATPLTPSLGSTPENLRQLIGDEACFVIDVTLSFPEKRFWGRILVPESFRREWKTSFAHLGPPEMTEEMRQKLMVELSLEVAHSHLQLDEWKTVKEGDFVLLDHCSYDPVEHKGAVVLTLKQKPVFRGRLKESGIKITNYPVHEEVIESMGKEPFTNNSFSSDESDDDIYGDLSEEEESEFEEAEDLFGLEPKEEGEEEKKPAKRKKAPTLSEGAPPPVSVSAEEIPVHLTVEVGRVRMSAAELMSLSPGNLLDLHVAPEQGVDLVVNGKKVGRGELIRMGDLLGVRIVEL